MKINGVPEKQRKETVAQLVQMSDSAVLRTPTGDALGRYAAASCHRTHLGGSARGHPDG